MMVKRAPIPPRPKPPKSRIICDLCGDISHKNKHTSWLCRFLRLLDSFKRY